MGKSLLGDSSKPDRYIYAHGLYDSFYVQIGNQHTRYFSYENYNGSKDQAKAAARKYRDELERKILSVRNEGNVRSSAALTTTLADGLRKLDISVTPIEPTISSGPVFWTLEEMQTLAGDAAHMSVRNPMTMLSAIRAAQLKLPKHRQREFQSSTNIPPALVELFNKTRESIIKGYETALETNLSRDLQVQEPVKQVTLSDFSEEEIYAELRKKSEERYAARFTALEKMVAERDSKIEAVVAQLSTLSQKISDQDALMEMLMEDVNKAATNLVYKTHQISDPGKKKINIAVAGLLNGQFNTVVQILANKEIELIHYPTDKSPNFSGHHDYIVLSKFISHSWQDTAHKVVGRERTYFVSGGLRSIVDTINQLASKYQDTKK